MKNLSLLSIPQETCVITKKKSFKIHKIFPEKIEDLGEKRIYNLLICSNLVTGGIFMIHRSLYNREDMLTFNLPYFCCNEMCV